MKEAQRKVLFHKAGAGEARHGSRNEGARSRLRALGPRIGIPLFGFSYSHPPSPSQLQEWRQNTWARFLGKNRVQIRQQSDQSERNHVIGAKKCSRYSDSALTFRFKSPKPGYHVFSFRFPVQSSSLRLPNPFSTRFLPYWVASGPG